MKMLIKLSPIVLLLVSCNTKRSSVSSSDIIGTYVRETSTTVPNINTGQVLGMSTIRDTIYISGSEDDFEINNRKWRLNDYDDGGWRNMEHSDNRPLPSCHATFNERDSSLSASTASPDVTFYLDLENRKLMLGEQRNVVYTKVEKPV